ncbi:MAG: universal stress protein [Pseudomonadota bacterium]
MGEPETFLAATDFSERADAALERAAGLAARHGARLLLLHVVERYSLETLRRLGAAAGAGPLPGLVERAREVLAERSARLAQTHGIAVQPEVAVGRVYREIVDRAGARGAVLTVIGGHGEHFFRDLVLGATAQKVVRHNEGSTLVVKQGAMQPYGRVLVPVDFSPGSRAALETVRRLAPDAALTILHAFELPFEGKLFYAGVDREVVERYVQAARREAQADLDALLLEWGAEGERPEARVVHGYAPDVIVNAARHDAFDLVALGARGRSELARFVLGSVSLHVMMEAPCDVLVVNKVR